ncbi:MAG: DUF302 domain-containing protein [Planctomycetes bacterium]|nr:DUF302 domain-containing protein [Planctomycetota bacterium]
MVPHIIIACVAGLIVGMVLMGWLVAVGMRRMMVVEHPSRYGFDETIERVKKAVEKADGWVFPIPEWHFSEVMVKHGKPFSSVDKLVVYFICKAYHAQNMVNAKPEMASIMPCGWAIYERGGKTYIGSMNIPMMALPFKGIIGKTFKAVGKEEEAMFKEILE